VAELSVIAPAFIEVAHRIVWCTVATVAPDGHPRTRVLHPIWEWDGERLQGWVATSPGSPKARDIAHEPRVSVTYWDATHDVATADCIATWQLDSPARHAGWNRFKDALAPVGYDPSIVPGWTDPDTPSFGVLRLDPTALRVMPGTLLLRGTGELLTWRATLAS
jgi:general stress protein 26